MASRSAWRIPCAVLTGMTVAAVAVVALDGRPTGAQRTAVVTGLVAAVCGALAARAVLRATADRSPRASAENALDGVAGRMTRPVPLDELLQQAVDALRAAPGRRAVELWQVRDGALALTHRSPLVDRAPIALDAAAAAVAGTIGVGGDAWLRTWFPTLVGGGHDDEAGEATRVAPLAAHGELVGMVVLRRAACDQPFDVEDDLRLGRIQRPLAAALNQARLTEALHATVAELRQRNAELQASRARLVSVAEHERRRLERDLHDGAQARLNALQLRLQFIRRIAAESPEQVDGLLAATADELSAAIDELRRLAHGLVPALLLTGGLGEALREAASRSGVDVQVAVADIGRHPAAIEAAVYYCCVEALQNVAKHAGPDATAHVEVTARDGLLVFTVSDDGRGLAAAPTPVGDTASGAGQGMLNIADRLGALGGTVSVGAAPRGGVVVHGEVPVNGGGDASDGSYGDPAAGGAVSAR